MKKLSTFLILLTVASASWAQSSVFEIGGREDRADRLFHQFSYAGAINLYKAVLDEEPENQRVQLQIAECYRMLNQPEEASNWYARIINNDTLVTADHFLHYAKMLQGSGQYEAAKNWYERYEKKMVQEDRRVDNNQDALANLDVYFKDSAMYEIELAPFNSSQSDFSPVFYEDGLVFVSARETAEMRITQNVFNWDKEPFLDLFFVGPDSLGAFTMARPWNEKINTQYHEGPIAFFDDGKRVVFTRNNYHKGRFGKSSDDINKLMLYSANVNGTNEKPLPFNSEEYSVGHPTFLADGRTMIFVSDMPGSLGGTDLWQTEWAGENWSSPINLGPTINTEGNEMFPYYHADGVLYLASDGHGGLGGLDLFASKFNNDQWQEPKNMGYPVNTRFDDFGLVLEPNGIQGYFSSNRISEEDDNIFRMAITREPYLRISGVVVDDITGKPLPNATVTMRGTNGEEVSATADDEAKFSFDLNWDVMYRFGAEKDQYEQVNAPLRKAEDTPEARKPLEIRMKNKCWEYAWALTDKETGEPVLGADVTLILVSEGDSIRLESDNGTYIIPMECGQQYNLHLEKKGYFAKTLHITPGNIPEPEFEEIVVGKAIEVENIYYDLNKADIRSDAAVELDKLVELLVENPQISIELSSHTDSRGSDVYNLDLSQRRAESAVAYIIEQGIASNRITAKGYGETRLNNGCSNGVRCSDEEHQANRRTEFAVTEVTEDAAEQEEE